jgi:hypothetical protein
MSKCKPSCCSDTSSSDGFMIVIGLIMLALALYGIIRAVWHIVIEIVRIVEIIAITLGSTLAAAILIAAAVYLARWHHAKRKTTASLEVTGPNLASPPVIATSGPGKPAQDAAELFAEAIANDMDPRFVERILKTAMESRDR